MNKYLEKVAILYGAGEGAIGAASADKGDRVGGALSGMLFGAVGGGLGHRIHPSIAATLVGQAAGGYIGGRVYSIGKDSRRSKSELKKHLELNRK